MRMPSRSASIGTALSANCGPKTRDNRPKIASNMSPFSGSARKTIRPSPPSETSRRTKPTKGSAMASRLITSPMACASARSERMNFSRAGVAKKRSLSVTTVPAFNAAGFTPVMHPPVTWISAPSWPEARVVMDKRPTAPKDGSASPLKPKLWMLSRSEPSIFEVAWRLSARGKSSPGMPQPSSDTRMRLLPPCE